MTHQHDVFMTAYLSAFEAMVTGDVAQARAVTLPEPNGPEQAFMAHRIARMLARHEVAADLCALDNADIRGWHYVLTGSILLHVAPAEPMGHCRTSRGRYRYLEDEDALIRECLAKLEVVLEALDLAKGPVIGLDTRESRIIGRAAADLFGVEARIELRTAQAGVLAAYDVGSLIEPVRKGYVHHRPGQVLYAHSASAVTELKPTADFIGVLYERRVSPWSRHAITEPGRTDLPSGPPTEDEAALAKRIADFPISLDQLHDLEEITALAVVAQALDALAATRHDGQREPLWRESPVPRD